MPLRRTKFLAKRVVCSAAVNDIEILVSLALMGTATPGGVHHR